MTTASVLPISSVPQRPGTRPLPYFGRSHPLAEVAGRHCAARHRLSGVARLGGVACGACWERAIRDDERVAVEHDLSRDIVPDPTYVDEIAVELACRGQRVELTRADQVAAVAHLAGRGWPVTRIALRLGTSVAQAKALLEGSLRVVDRGA
ncbi:MAG: hypothetical protein HKP61_21945 [Dactylosporangium sp.]|nr:hypothetical protein [Dactylosporangium sp.]NNJ63543.1 hypothetical protein [Dactylosporangium sp.]